MAKLQKLDCHDAIGAAARYERAVKMVPATQIINWGITRSQRWVVFVNNGFISTVVLSHGMRNGLCTCEDFRKNLKTCKHIYAAVMKINHSMEEWEFEKKEKAKRKALELKKLDAAREAVKAEEDIQKYKYELNVSIEKALRVDRVLERIGEIQMFQDGEVLKPSELRV